MAVFKRDGQFESLFWQFFGKISHFQNKTFLKIENRRNYQVFLGP